MKIIDLSAGNRAVWFNRDHPDATYIDVRKEVGPTFVADARSLPSEVGDGYDLIVFDPPHKNSGASGKMAANYGHWTHDEIRSIIVGTAQEAHRIGRQDALMAFKWNEHSLRLHTVLVMLDPWWEPLFGHGARAAHRHEGMTHWVMLKRRDLSQPFELVSEAAE